MFASNLKFLQISKNFNYNNKYFADDLWLFQLEVNVTCFVKFFLEQFLEKKSFFSNKLPLFVNSKNCEKKLLQMDVNYL